MRSHNRSQLLYSSLSIYLFFACTEACQIEFLTQSTSVDTCLIFYLSAYIGNVSLFTRVRGIIWHITQMGNANTIFLCKGQEHVFSSLNILSVSDTVRSPFNCNGWTPHLLRNVCNQRRSEQECPLTRIIYCSLLFRRLNFAHNSQTCSPKFILWMNEKLVILKNVDILTLNYVIVLSSVLFGYGTFICINTIDIILWFYIHTNEV